MKADVGMLGQRAIQFMGIDYFQRARFQPLNEFSHLVHVAFVFQRTLIEQPLRRANQGIVDEQQFRKAMGPPSQGCQCALDFAGIPCVERDDVDAVLRGL